MRMKKIDLTAIYILWSRETKRFLRARSRIIGTLAIPLLVLCFLGIGFDKVSIPGLPPNLDYFHFLVPGIIAVTVFHFSMISGISVLWDREFGFLKEIMVAPVSRLSIMLGRIAGGITTALVQGILILLISIIMGFRADIMGFRAENLLFLLLALLTMFLIAVGFMGLGLVFASQIKDIQGFNLIMQFTILPLSFLSASVYPLENLPPLLTRLSLLNPLTYGVNALRKSLLGVSSLPISTSLLVLAIFDFITILLGVYLFEKSESI